MIYFFLSICFILFADDCLQDLEEKAQDYVLETKHIEIPGYPDAFNPSIIRWNDFFLMSFRVIPDARNCYNSNIGLIILDKNFSPISAPQLLAVRNPGHPVPCRTEDARLLYVGEKLYIVYSDNEEQKLSKGGYRVYIAELQFNLETALGPNPEKQDLATEATQKIMHCYLQNIECLNQFENENHNIREKNWVPFDYYGHLYLAYSLAPHMILYPILGSGGFCVTVAKTPTKVNWPLGPLRGGTPALRGLIENEYLSFFHSSIRMSSLHSEGKQMLHYFMGAYTFSAEYPFQITKISPEPIIGKEFYKGRIPQHYWHPVRVVFPCGFVFNEEFIWVAYGRQDHEIWITKLDREKFLATLVPVNH